MNRNKIIIYNIGLAVILAIIWTVFLSKGYISFKNTASYLWFISLLAAPVDLLAGLVFLAAKKKIWAAAMLWSSAIFALILLIGFVAVKF